MPHKTFNEEIFPPQFLFAKKMRTWMLPLGLERLVQFLGLKALLMVKEKALRAHLVLPRVRTPRPPTKKYPKTKLVNWTWPDSLKKIWPPWKKKKKNSVRILLMTLLWQSQQMLPIRMLHPLLAKQKL